MIVLRASHSQCYKVHDTSDIFCSKLDSSLMIEVRKPEGLLNYHTFMAFKG